MNNLIVDIAAREVGVKEEGGNNKGARIQEYQSATWLAPAPWPWCAAFVDWCLFKWLDSSLVRDWLSLTDAQAEQFRPKTAGAWDLANWAKKNSNRVSILPEEAPGRPGDIIIFDFSHVGIVEKDNGPTFSTIEGNTNIKGERDSVSGDGVWRKTRAQSLAKSLLRIHPLQ